MAGNIQSLIFELIARDQASPAFAKLAATTKDASGNVSELSRRVTELGTKSANTRVSLSGDKEAQASLDKLDARLLSLAHKGNIHLGIEGAARAAAEVSALDLELDRLGKRGGSADTATGALTQLGSLSGPTGMGALISAGVVLSPVVATLGVGLGGLAAAAYGTLKPVEAASQKAGGLQKNLHLLNPEQQAVALSLHGLGVQYDQFQHSLQPQVLGAFSQGLKIASQIMRDAQPVARATGTAFDQFLGQFGATLQDPQWRQFWAFMAQTAPQDMRLVGQLIIDLANDVPVLLQKLQPAAVVVLQVSDAAAKLVVAAETANRNVSNWIHNIPGLGPLLTEMSKDVSGLAHQIGLTGGAAGKTAPAIGGLGAAADKAAPKLQSVADAVNAITTAENQSLLTQTTYASDLVTSANDAAALQKALKASHDQIGLHTQAQRDSFGAATQYINDLARTASDAIASGHGVDAAIRAISGGLPVLDKAKTKNRQYWQEVRTLTGQLDRLRKLVAEGPLFEKIQVLGIGSWSVVAQQHALGQGPGPFARGGLITAGTTGTADDVLIRASRGEAVLSAQHVAMLAPLLKAAGVPGMAAGGVVGSYSGNVGGLPRWAWGEMRETLHAVATSVAQAFTAALGALGGLGGGGPASGSVLALERFAASLFPRFGWSGMQILPLGALWTRESGWNRFATNPSSGAYGIPQALPFTKMPVAAWPLWAGGQSSAAAQIGWGEPYIAQRYGTPAGAWAHEQAFGWYGDGLDAVFTRPTLIGVGERGMEHVSVTPAGRGPRTVNYNITVNVPPTVNPKQAGQQIAQLILEHTKVGGRLYPAGITPR